MSDKEIPDISDARRNEIGSINDALLIREMPVGTKVRLRNGAICEVVGNPQDGGWLFVKFVEHEQEPARIGEEFMAYCTEVVDVVK
jgi:hypothetical protein